MAATRSAAAKLDWSNLPSRLGLRGNTAAALSAFKTRNDNARRRVQSLQENSASVDFQQYRSILNNKGVIDEIESAMRTHKIKSYDVARQIKTIETFEAQAVKNAEDTAKTVETELRELEATLENIKQARPFGECTTDEVLYAEPELDQKVENMVKNHRWMPPGYKEKFGDLSLF
ncbi:MAG: ATP synthase d subunit [Chrysothrix sp. TS-e1954]|nr:MAG: ATP synthase d subunit [Chrysothrix sp. TS-e1954]